MPSDLKGYQINVTVRPRPIIRHFMRRTSPERKHLINSGAFELVSRGLMWSRVLFLAMLMPAGDYSFAMLLISAEALIGSFISYPQIKDLLMRQQVHLREITRTVLLFGIVLPLSVVAVALYFNATLAVIAVVVGALFFGLGQVLLYLLRIDDLARYNRFKIIGAATSTAIFLLVLPVEPLLLPSVQLSYCAVLSFGFRDDTRFSWAAMTEAVPWSELTRTWAIFGTQALASNVSVYGSRLIAGAALSLTDVKVLTVSYMLASGVTFYYSVIMIYAEKELSRKLNIDNLKSRLNFSAFISLLLFVGLIFYGLSCLFIWLSLSDYISDGMSGSFSPNLVLIFLILFAFRAIVLCINPVVIALGRRGISLTASIISGLSLLLLLFFTWNTISLNSIGMAMVAASAAQVAVLLWAFVR